MRKQRSEITNNNVWGIIGSYFDKQHLKQLVRHQIESYNRFVDF